ncbi:MAG TPA: sulfite exporter TauE/SafE family protein [Trebonia sp.]
MTGLLTALLLLGAGTLAGVVGTAGGITSLISYPALLLAGVPALPATIANTIAIVACWPGSALASRPELAGRGRWVGKWGTAAALGGAAGAVLLLSTPPGVFSRVVPFLIAAGSTALLLQPWLRSADASAVAGPARQWFLGTGVVALSAYNGYFGAGTGVLLLALTLATTDGRLARANALKNMLVGAASVAAAVLFAVVSPVDWSAVIPLAVGLFLGSTIGPRVARRVPATALRWLVALLGLAFAVRLWISPA